MGKKIQAIGKYTLTGQTLGKGTFARVALAIHDVTKCKVAVKIINTRKITEDYHRGNLYREAKIISQMRHPNIVRFYESLKADVLYCLVTEWAMGGDILVHMKTFTDRRFTESVARLYVRQMVSALHYLHERGVVHRDFKMENIMLDEKKKNIKIVDFGLSNYLSHDGLLRTHCGSPEYAAPELFISNSQYGSEIDLWSLGIIIYTCLVGILPFTSPYHDHARRQRLLNLINKGLTAKHNRDMQHLTHDARNLIRQLIEPKPELRLPLSEVEIHLWITKSGTRPFAPYCPPPREPSLKSQSECSWDTTSGSDFAYCSSLGDYMVDSAEVSSLFNNIKNISPTSHKVIENLASLVNLSKKEVERSVHEFRSNELSAMFNMLLEVRKKELGVYNEDHTLKPLALVDPRTRQKAQEKWRILRSNLKESARIFREVIVERELREKEALITGGGASSVPSGEGGASGGSKSSSHYHHTHSQRTPLQKQGSSVSAGSGTAGPSIMTNSAPGGVVQSSAATTSSSLTVATAGGGDFRRRSSNVGLGSQQCLNRSISRSRRPSTLELRSNVNAQSSPLPKPKVKKKKERINPVGVMVVKKKPSLFPPKRPPFTLNPEGKSPTSPGTGSLYHHRSSRRRRNSHQPCGDSPTTSTATHRRYNHSQHRRHREDSNATVESDFRLLSGSERSDTGLQLLSSAAEEDISDNTTGTTPNSPLGEYLQPPPPPVPPSLGVTIVKPLTSEHLAAHTSFTNERGPVAFPHWSPKITMTTASRGVDLDAVARKLYRAEMVDNACSILPSTVNYSLAPHANCEDLNSNSTGNTPAEPVDHEEAEGEEVEGTTTLSGGVVTFSEGQLSGDTGGMVSSTFSIASGRTGAQCEETFSLEELEEQGGMEKVNIRGNGDLIHHRNGAENVSRGSTDTNANSEHIHSNEKNIAAVGVINCSLSSFQTCNNDSDAGSKLRRQKYRSKNENNNTSLNLSPEIGPPNGTLTIRRDSFEDHEPLAVMTGSPNYEPPSYPGVAIQTCLKTGPKDQGNDSVGCLRRQQTLFSFEV